MIDRKQIKAALPYGGQRHIAQRSGATEAHVSQWFANRSNSQTIEDAALEVYAEAVAAQLQRQAKFEAAQRGEKI